MQTTPPTISLCIIAKNEEQWLKQCIDSVKSIVQEIIVLDTGSTDATVKIANECGAAVHHFSWNDDFSAARNECIRHATKDWTLILDADEAIAAKDHHKILAAVQKDADGYFLVQRNYTLPEAAPAGTLSRDWVPNDSFYEESKPFSGFQPNPILRLFRNKKGYQFRYRVHEDVYPSIAEKNEKVDMANIVIHHYHALKPAANKKASLEKYHRLIEQQAAEYPNDTTVLQYLGMLHLSRRDVDKAIPVFESILQLDPFHGLAHKCLGILFAQKTEMRKAMEHFAKAIKLIPKDADPYLDLALLFKGQGNQKQAVKILGMATKQQIKNPIIYNTLGVFLLEMGNVEEAVQTLEYALTSFANHPSIVMITNNLFEAYIASGQVDKAIPLLEGAIAKQPSVPSYYDNLLQIYEQTGQREKTVELLTMAVKYVPATIAQHANYLEKLRQYREQAKTKEDPQVF